MPLLTSNVRSHKGIIMNLRNSIQQLALWYIPVAIASAFISAWYTGFLNEAMNTGEYSMGSFMVLFSAIPMMLKASINLVVAIWLYSLISKSSGNKYIWFLFGLIAHLYAAVIYIGLLIYEQVTSNKALNSDSAKSAEPVS